MENNNAPAGLIARLCAFIVDALILILPLYTLINVASLQPLNHAWTGVGINLAHLLMSWLYCALCESSTRQATPGKMLMKIMVLDKDGQRLSFGKASLRFYCKLPALPTLGLSFAMAVLNEKRQALHDKVAGSVVVSGR